MQYPDTECRGEALAEAGTEPDEACQHDQAQGHQWQQKLAPPHIYADTQEDTEKCGFVGSSVTTVFIRLIYDGANRVLRRVFVTGLTGAQQVLSTVVVARFFVLGSELLRDSEAAALQHHLGI